GTVVGLVAALRFFFNKTLKRHLPPTDIPYPKHPRRLPAVLTVEEVARLIDSARNLLDRTLLMVLYSTGMRNCELRHLQVKDIDSKSMLIHIQRGKGGRDRYVPLSPRLLETLREYWRWGSSLQVVSADAKLCFASIEGTEPKRGTSHSRSRLATSDDLFRKKAVWD